jgi:uncharacterized membrane protein YgdD (TMEM256/DUF423 family)
MHDRPLDATAARLGFVAALSGMLAVLAGAFGSHTLRDRLDPGMMAVFETGVRYHLVHAPAMLGAAWVLDRTGLGFAAAAGWLFAAGTVLFSGSLYALALTGIRLFGLVTPLGGLCFIAGWLCLALALARSSR